MKTRFLPAPSRILPVILVFLLSFVNIRPVQAQTALQFDGTNDYVTFGQATTTLGAINFTLEAWVKRAAGGKVMSTGSGGFDNTGGRPNIYPVVTKGMGEGETPANLNMNYFLGITSTGYIGADFEDNAGGVNHPVWGTKVVPVGEWHHIAATYNGQTWNLYLDGVLDITLTLVSPFTPESTSIQHAALGTGLQSSGTPNTTTSGYFAGLIEEPRIWNVARSQAEIQAGMNQEILTGTGLIGRWGLNDGSGTTALNSITGSPAGTLTNGPVWATGITYPPELWAVQFNGSNQYGTSGVTPSNSPLNTSSFTVETWFKRTGAGVGVTTGGSGIASAIPLVTKGTSEGETASADINYFLGIDASSGVLCADFEEAQTGASPSLNHPVSGTTVIVTNTWYHAAVTYDGNKWQLFLNGNLERELVVGRPANAAVLSPFSLATSIQSNGTTVQGYFSGVLDEVRLWNYARTQAEILATINSELTSGSGLLGRWGLDEGLGTAVSNSIAGNPNVTLSNGPLWVFGAPFNITLSPPAAPTGITASAASAYQINLSWTDNSSDETSFEIWRSGNGVDFQLLASVAANVISYSDVAVNSSAQYYYRVRAVNGTGTSSFTSDANATTQAENNSALSFGSNNAYVTYGQASALGTESFTLECWFIRTGTGAFTTTGAGGVLAIPLISKGMAEGDGSTLDMNYFLGINSTTQVAGRSYGPPNVLVADFEEGPSPSSNPGLNHPVAGITPIANDTWYHAAVTYDAGTSTWRLYLNGNLEKDTVLAAGIRIPQSNSIQHAALGTALQSNGLPGTSTYGPGYFNGTIDEARIWNYARTREEIVAGINSQIITPQSGMIGRWGLNENAGAVVNGNAGAFIDGAVTGSGYSWVSPGAPFNITYLSPASPSNLTATALSGTSVALEWTDNSDNETGFEVERSTTGSTGTYSLITTLAPDVIAYTDGSLSPGNQYCYRVRAINTEGNSGYTSSACATTLVTGTASVSFQEGVNGYAGTVDTHLQQTEADVSHGGMDYFKWDTDSNGGIMFGLLRFDGIFGSGEGQIPANAVIQSAYLTYTVYNIGNDANIYEAAVGWDEDVTYSNFGGDAGVQADEYGTLVTTAPGSATGVYQVDVTSSIAKWVANPSLNLGWLFYPSGTDGVQVRSSEYATTIAERPRLTISYIANPPAQPVLVAPADNAVGVPTSPTLYVSVSDPESRNLTVNYYGRKVSAVAPGSDFTVVILPDAQNYTAGLSGGTLDMFTDQTNWCVSQRTARNIAYVVMEGDITNDNNTAQWANAVTAMSILESPSPGIPYGIAVGNHDGAPSTTSTSNTGLYNDNFGIARFSGRPYYGGHYGTDNDNNYALFTAGGLDFIVINLGLGTYAPPSTAVLSWANGLLQTYSNRRAIVVNHGLLTGTSWFGPGQAIYDALKGNANLFMMLCGHLNTEYMRTDTYNGNTVYTILTDYQGVTNGGNGWLRMLTFSPANNMITVSSYSPHLNQSNYSAPVILDYNMAATNPYELIGTATGVASGGTAGVTWPGLDGTSEYEWYVTVSNGESTITGPVWSFTTLTPIAWTGTTNSDWNTATNWSTGVEPGPTDEVIIDDVTNDPVIASSGWGDAANILIRSGGTITVMSPAPLRIHDDLPSAGNLVINSGGSLNVMPGAMLNVDGNLTNTGSLIIDSDLGASGSMIVRGTSTGNVTFLRQLRTDEVTGDRHFFSSPVGGLTVTDFGLANAGKIEQAGSDYQIWSWREPDASWQLLSSASSLVPGIGYNLDQNEVTDGKLSFTGTVVKSCTIPATSPYKSTHVIRETPEDYGVGNETADIWASERSWVDYGGGGWNLLGNPFTSAMSAIAFIGANIGQFDPNYQALYVYDGTTQSYRFAAASYPGPLYPMNGFFAEHVTAGQGFFVLALNEASSFTFNSGMQDHLGRGVLMLKSSQDAETWPGLQLNVRYGEKESSTLIVYNSNMTAGLDPGFDVGQLSTVPAVEIYTSLVEKDNSVNFAQQALPLTDCNRLVVPVGIDSKGGGEVAFSAFTLAIGNNKFWLEDRTTGVFTDLTTGTYRVTLPANTYGTGRFFIYASANIPTSAEKPVADENSLRIWTSGDRVIIRGEVGDKANCEVYDVNGKLVVKRMLTDNGLNTVDLPQNARGVFFVRVTDGIKTHTQKVVIL